MDVGVESHIRPVNGDQGSFEVTQFRHPEKRSIKQIFMHCRSTWFIHNCQLVPSNELPCDHLFDYKVL